MVHFFLPSVLLALSILLSQILPYAHVLVLPIPFINTSLLLAPLAGFSKSKSVNLIILLAAILTTVWAFKPFLGSSIFYFSQDDQQKIIRQSYLYPDIYTARLFQNKPSIYINRFLFNFFAITDPNNYFFGFHPREIAVQNQNLQKFPFLAIIFFLVGLYFAVTHNKRLLIILLILILNLSLLRNFDKTDAVLWLPLSLLIIDGLFRAQKWPNKFKIPLLALFFIFTLTEYLHLIIGALY